MSKADKKILNLDSVEVKKKADDFIQKIKDGTLKRNILVNSYEDFDEEIAYINVMNLIENVFNS